MTKHKESINILQQAVDAVIEKHPDERLVVSVSLCIMDENHNPETVQLMQFGIKDALCLLLRESLEHTQQEDEDFIGNKIASVTIN